MIAASRHGCAGDVGVGQTESDVASLATEHYTGSSVFSH